MRNDIVAGALAAVLLWTGSAAAQTDFCINPSTGQPDQAATATWQQMRQTADPSLMQALVGTWYAEIRAPATNQVDYHYTIYEPGGLFQYQSRVCGGMMNACSDYSGQGGYAARGAGDGSMMVMLLVSDLNRNQQCVGSLSRFTDGQTIVDSTGTTWRKVR